MDKGNRTITRAELEKKIARKAREDNDFKKALLDNPREALGQLGVKVPAEVEVRVIEEPPRVVYLVLPVNPEEQLDDVQLNSVAGGGGCNNFQGPPQARFIVTGDKLIQGGIR
ncbi:hypothetical protein PTH_2301 [Pelotomaculum thermopropionicum SI]|uniref:Nitrile hydratase alpha/Thiocyanate hydrolase gamma domain-containing protein n=1 Tax=Pelotomaculum thermopropionicum (strain DSM 13744 / JCM 10971 / SI) TaxID=370438 RepID=A5CZU4_PELTS|nr:hypothetical protein PTH_2301 [Pelotomaculum thermopropionicum SI]